jgi:exodeoxyribonuclease VII large subunit
VARQRDDTPDLFAYAAAKEARGSAEAQPAADEPEPQPGSRGAPLSIAELVRRSSKALERAVGTIWVEGEIASASRASSGHLYMVLKDDGAQLRCVMWRSDVSRMRFRLEVGQRLRCRGKVSIYERDGRFQFYVHHAEPAGLGEEALALEQLKRRLASEGLFATERKRPLPHLPRRIGVVTSRSGAAIRDVVKAVWRRYPVPILLADAVVQGAGAPDQIVAGLRALYATDVDVIIVGRGGGSASDLGAFNDESVVRTVAASPVPIISAVGHEVDISLADLAADQRAATPTMAGEMAVPVRAELAESLQAEVGRLGREMELSLRSSRQELDTLIADAQHSVVVTLAEGRRALTEARGRLATLHPRSRIQGHRASLSQLEARLRHCVQRQLEGCKGEFRTLAGRLQAMSPLGVLDRGYALATDSAGDVISDAGSVSVGDRVSVRLARGSLSCTVDETQDEQEEGRG